MIKLTAMAKNNCESEIYCDRILYWELNGS